MRLLFLPPCAEEALESGLGVDLFLDNAAVEVDQHLTPGCQGDCHLRAGAHIVHLVGSQSLQQKYTRLGQ